MATVGTEGGLRRTEGLSLSYMDIILMVEVFLLAFVYSGSEAFFPGLRTPVYYLSLAIALIFIPLSFSKSKVAGAAGVGILLTLLGYMFLFTLNYGTTFTGEMIASFTGLLTVGLFAYHAAQSDLRHTLFLFFIACCVYLGLYFFVVLTLDVMSLVKTQMAGGEIARSIMRTHDSGVAGSGNTAFRIRISAIHMSFGLFYSLAMIQERNYALKRSFWIGSAVLFGAAVLMSDFRYMLAIVVATIILHLLPIRIAIKASAVLAANVVSIITFMFFALMSINAFVFMANDSTGYVRVQEVNLALEIIEKYPLLGMGLWNNASDFTIVFGAQFMAPSDIGYFGEIMQHGLLGLFLILISNFVIFLLTLRLGRDPFALLEARTILMAFAFIVGMQIMTTLLWESGGSLILALSIAYLTKDSGIGRPLPRPARAA